MQRSEAQAAEAIGYRFGVFRLDIKTLELTKSGRLVKLRPQSLKVLALLLARPGELVPRADLKRELWDRDTFVDYEQGVNHCVKELRAALGDVAESPRFIETLARRGYRFIAPVEGVPASPPRAARWRSSDPSGATVSRRGTRMRPWPRTCPRGSHAGIRSAATSTSRRAR